MTTVTPALQNALLNLSNTFVPSEGHSVYKVYYTKEDFLQCGIMLITTKGELYDRYVSTEDANRIFFTFDITHDAIQTFHKSWEKVATEDYVTLLAEQIVHYFSTYGLEHLGYGALPLVPVEELIADPTARPSFQSFRVITVVSAQEAQKVIDNTLRTTKAPHRMNMGFYKEYVENTTLKDTDIASNELRIMWYRHNNTVPQNGQDFIRYALYDMIEATLVIKNNHTVNAFKRAIASKPDRAYELLSKVPPVECAKVFHRYKPFFLAFKASKECKPLVNEFRRLADFYHKPVDNMTFQNISKLMKEGHYSHVEALLKKATMRQLVKLYNFYLDQSAMEPDKNNTGVFAIRNGKVHIEPDYGATNGKRFAEFATISKAILEHMVEKAGDSYKNKIYYIPEYVTYSTPTTEKQFIGSIPNGTKLIAPANKPFSAAICWDNYKGRRTDIDLHMVGVNESYGWNSYYRDDERAVLYSGDMTDASNGAAEAFYFKPDGRDFVLTTNNFTGEIGVPFKFFISESKPIGDNRWGRITTPPIDVSTAIFPPIPLSFPDAQGCTLGMFMDNVFVFYNGSLDMGCVPDRTRYAEFIDAMKRKMTCMLELDTFLRICGARVIRSEEFLNVLPEEARASVIDLSPEALTNDTLMGLVDAFDN